MNDEQLYAFVADARAQTSAAARRRTRWLHRQLREDVSMARLYDDLARVRASVELTLIGGRTYRGRMAAAARDLVLLSCPDGTAYVSAHAITGVRLLAHTVDGVDEGGSASGGDLENTAAPLRETHVLADVLADSADEHGAVRIGTADVVYEGTLGGVARDFVWFDDDARCLRVDAITDLMIGSRR